MKDLRCWADLFGILYQCPVGKRLPECPLKSIDKLSYKSRVAWMEALNDEEKHSLLQHHYERTSHRVNEAI